MQIWITFILINIIHQTHVSAAPVDSSFAKIADTIINPAWIKNNPDSPKKNGENIPIDGEIDDSNTKNKKKNNSRRKNKTSGKKRNNNKTRNNRRRNNTGHNGRYLWYSVFTVDELLVNLPEYRNHEDEQKIVLIWDDKRKIVQNEHVDALSMYNLNNNQLIRQKRDNILELQDNILKKKYINQHDWEENENSMSSNSNENIKENMEFLNLRNSNTNKLKNILKNRKQPTNTIRNEISRPSHAQGLGIPLGADISEKEESQLKIIEENPQKINAKTTLSNDKPELIIGENTSIDKNTPEIEKIDTLINEMNSNSNQSADYEQDSKSYPLSIETKNKITNYSYIEENKQHDIIKNIKHQFKPKTRKLEKKQPKNNDEGTLQTRFTLNAPSKNDQKTPSIPEHKIEGNTDIAKNIPTNDEIETLLNALNSNSQENSSSENSDLSTSSLEKQQDILDLSDLGDNKEKNLLKSIKQPSKPISKIEGKTLLENNEKLPEIYEKYLNNPSETNTKNKKGSQQIGNTPSSLSINNQQTPSINVPGHITPEHTDISQNIPSNVEIETLMNAINLNSEEGTDDQNSEPYSSSLEIKQEIPNYSDDENNKQHDILKNIETPFKLKPRKLGKIRPKNNDKGTLQTRFTPNAPSKNYQKTASIDIPEHKTEGTTDISQNIPSNVEIETLMNAINLNSEEGTDDQNSEPYSSSLEIKQEIPNYSDDENNKQHDILKNIETPFKLKPRKLGKIRPKNNDKGTLQTRFTPNAPRKNYQKTASIDIPEHKTEGTTDISQNIPSNVEIETLMNAINLNSEEGTDDQNSEPYSSSLEIKQEIPNYSDDENNKQHDILKNIETPFKLKPRKLGKIRPKNNDKGTLQTRFTPNAPSKNYQKTASIDIPEHKTEGTTDISQNIPSNVEIETLMNAINLNSEEGTDDQNSEPYSSSLEIKQEIPNYSDDENNKQHDILKKIETPFKPKTRKLGKIRPKNNDKGTLQTRFTPNAPSKNYQKTASIDIPEQNTEGNTDNAKNIHVNDEIDTLINIMHSNLEEDSIGQNSDSNPSSLDKQQYILDFSDLGDNKGKNLLKSIKQPLKPLSKMQEKKLLENNEKLPGIYKQKFNNSLEINKKDEEGPQQKTLTLITQNLDQDKIKSTPAYDNFKSNIIQKKKSIKTPDLMDTIDQETTNTIEEISIEIPLDDFGDSDGLQDQNNTRGMTMKGAAIGNMKDKSPSSVLNNKNKKDHKDGHQKINQNPNRNIHKTSIKKSKSIKTPDLIDTTVPKSTEKVIELTTETPLNDNDVLNPLGEYNKLGGFTMEDAALEIIKDETPSSTLNYNSMKDHDDSLQVTNQPMLMKPNTVNPNTEHNEDVHINIDEVPKSGFDGNEKKKFVEKFGSNSLADLFGGSLDFNEEDLSEPSINKKKVIPISKPNNVIKNVEDEKLQPIQTNNDNKSNIIQKSKSIKTPDLIDTTVPKSTEKVIELTTETPLNDNDVLNPLGEYNKLGGFTMEDAALEIIKDETPSSTLNYNSMKDHDDSLQVTNQPMLMKPNTVNPNTEHNEDVHINIDEVPKSGFDGNEKKKFVEKFGSNSLADLFGGSLDFNEEDLSEPSINKKKVIPISKPNNVIKNVEDEKLQPIQTNNDNKSNIIQKSKSIKTPDLIDTTVPKSTEKVIELTTETPLNDNDVLNPLGEYNKLGGFTMEDAALEIIKDETPSSTLNYNSMKDHDDSLQVTNQPMLMKPNTVNPNTEHNEDVHINIDEVPKSGFDGNEKKKFVEKFGSNSLADLFGGSLDFNEEDLSEPSINKKKVIPISKPNNVIKNVEDEKLQPIQTNNDNKSNIIQKSKSIKTPDLIDTTVPKSTEKVIELTTETPLNDNDVLNPLGEYNKLGGFTMEDAALEIIKDETPSSTLNYNSMKDHDDSLQVTNQPMLMKPNTVNPNTEHNEDVHINIDEVPKSGFDGNEKKKFVEKFGSNSLADLFGGSLDFNEEDLSEPSINKKKVIPISKPNNVIKNVEDEKLQPIQTNNDNKSNIIQKSKSIKTPDLIDTTVPKSTEKVIELTTETPLNDNDVLNPLGEYNKLGGFTMEDAALEIIKDETPSSKLNYNSMKDHDDSLQVTNQPMLMKPNTVNPNTEHNEDVHINIDEVSKSGFYGNEKKKFVEKFGSNSLADLFGGSLDFNEEDLSEPSINKKKVIPISKPNNVIKNVEDEKLQPIQTNNDNKSNIIQKSKSIKTSDLIDTTVPKSTEKVIELTTETPLNDNDVLNPLGEYNKLGGFTMEDAALEIIKDETPSSTLSYNSMKDHDDSLQVTKQPMLMKPNTVNPNTEHNEDVHINIDEVPKSGFDGNEKKKFVEKFGSNSLADLFGGSLDFNEEDLSEPSINKKKVIPISKPNNVIKNVEDEKLQPIQTNNDNKSNIIQKSKSIKTPDLIDTTVPKSTEKVIELTTETPLNDNDVLNPLGEYNKLGGFTMEDAALEIIKDETPSSTLNYNSMKDHDDSLQVTNQPMLMKPNTVNPNTEHNEDVHINIDEVSKSGFDGNEKKKFVEKFGSNSLADLFGGSLDFNEEDLSEPSINKKKVIPISKPNNVIKNVEDEKLQPIQTNNDNKSNIIQKSKSIKTPDLIDTTVPKSTEKVIELTTETPLNDNDVLNPLGEYNKLGGFTMEDTALEIIKDETPSSTLSYNSMKDHDDSLQVTNQPMLMKPNTVNPNTEHNEDIHINIDEVPKSGFDGNEKKKFVEKFGSNSLADLFGGSLDFNEEDLSEPSINKKKVIPISKPNNVIKNVEDEKLRPIQTNNDIKSNIIQKSKSIKTPDLIDTTVPKSTEKVVELTTETPLNDNDVLNPLGEYNKLGEFTMEDAALEIIKDETPSSTLNYNSMKDHDDSLQVTNQPMLMKPNTVNPNTEHNEDVHINIDEVPKSGFDGNEKKKFVEKFGSNSLADLFGGSLDFNEEDLSEPSINKKKVIPISKPNNVIKNVEDEKLQPIQTNNDNKSNIIQKSKSIKTPDLIDTTVPKSTEKVIELTTETPLNDNDVLNPLGEYNKLGGFTMEDAALEIIKDETPSSTLNYNSMKDHDDSLQVTNQPMLMKPNTVNPNTEHNEDVHINIDEVPKSGFDGNEKKKFVEKFGSNSLADLFGGSLDFNEEDLSEPSINKKKVIPISKPNNVIKNVEDEKLQPIQTNNDIKSNIIQKSKSIKTPDLIDTTVPKSTEKVVELTTETPLNDNDVLNPLGEYNKLGGFTMEDAALEIIKDETPSSTLNYNSMKDHDDSLQVTNQPMLMKPNTVNPNTEHNEDVHINIDEVPKSGFDGNEKKKFVEKFGSNSLADLFGGSLDFNEEDLSEPSINKKKVIPISKPNNVIKNVEDEKLQPIQTNNDNKSNIIQKSKSIKTPDLIDTTVPKSTEKVIELTTETPLNDNDVLNPLGEYNKLGGFTMEDAALEIIKDETPSSTLNYNSKKDNDDNFQKINEPKFIYPVTEESYTKYNVGDVTKFKTYTPSTTTNNEEIPKNLSGSHGNIMLDDNINSNPIDNFFGSSISFDKIKLPQPGYKDKDVITKPGNILPNLDDVTLITTLTDDDIKPNSLQKNKFIKKLNPVSNTDSIMFDLIEPTTQINYDILKNDNNLPLSKFPSNVIDKHSSNSNTIHKYNNNLLENDKDVTFNRSLITNPCVEYNSKDLSSLEDDDRYGYMLPKFSTKYSEGGESNYNLWETIPPKKNDDVSSDKGYDNLINDFNQSSDFTTKNNKISSHTLNENSIVTGTESVKNNNYNIDKVNTDIHNKQYDDLIKKMSEQLFKKIDNIDDKLAKLDKVSHNSSYVREIGNIGSHEPTMNNVLLSNGIPISKPEKVINIEDSYSKTTKPSSLEINTSNKSDDENEINKNESPKAKKHKNKKHKRHGNKKKDEKNNTSNDDDGEDDDDDDDDNYDGNRKNNKRHKHKDKHNDDDGKHKKNKRHKNKDLNKDDDKHKKNKRHKNKDKHNDDDGKHKQNKRHKNKDINNDDGGKHKKNKRHKNKDLNDNDNGKHKKNNGHKKNKTIDDDNDNGGHRKKSHKKTYNKVDDDIVSKHKKHKSNKKKDRNYNDVELLQSKITDNKKKKKIKENVYSTEESNDVNHSYSIQINSENSDSVKRLKTTSSKSKISKKTNSTKSKKSPPKKKSKYVKHSKTIKYKNKEIPVDVSDEDTSSNENNYNSEKTYIKYISNNKQNNVPKDKKHKHKKHNKHSKTSKTYIYKKIPGDNDSDENGVNLEETYNINIISDDDALRQKKHRHKKKKNFDINIVKDTDTDTDTQVLNNDKKPQTGYQFYLLSPQYRYATLNPFARLF